MQRNRNNTFTSPIATSGGRGRERERQIRYLPFTLDTAIVLYIYLRIPSIATNTFYSLIKKTVEKNKRM